MEGGAFYLHDEPGAVRLEVRGRLNGALAGEMLAAIATARSILNRRTIIVDLRKAASLEPEASASLAGLPDARFLAREENLARVAALLPRPPRLLSESRLPLVRRWWCALLHRLRPGCSCSFCYPERIWSL